VQNNWDYAESAVFGLGVTRLDHVVVGETITDIQVNIENVVGLVRFHNLCKLAIFTQVFDIFRVDLLFCEIYQNTPAPILLF